MDKRELQAQGAEAFHRAVLLDSTRRGWPMTATAIAERLGVAPSDYSEARRGAATLTRIAQWCDLWHQSGGTAFVVVSDGAVADVREKLI